MSESGSYGKRPKCNECGTSMANVYVRKGTYRYTNLGYYCKFCEGVCLNNGIKSIKGPLYIGLEQVIE